MKIISSILTALGAFFFPIQGLLIAVGAAITLDTFTGIFKAWKLGGWKSVRSRKASDIGGKLILYNTVILSLFVMDVNLLGEFFKHWFSVENLVTKVAAVVLAIIELKSIKENIDAAYKTDVWLLLKKMLQRGKELKNDLTDLTE